LTSKASALGRRNRLVGQDRGHDDPVDHADVEVGLVQGVLDRQDGEVGRIIVIGRVAPLADSGQPNDLLFGAMGKCFQDFTVGANLTGSGVAHPGDAYRVGHGWLAFCFSR
jgi:hypothetical protein